MLDIHAISLTNFRSYRGNHSFKFPDQDGLYFLTGLNNQALGSNGAGKSTFLDAITWVLYGRTTRGLKANEIITWGETTCQAELELTVGQRYVVKRTQKPNGLYLDGTPIDQDALEKHIRLNYEAFLCTVIKSQFGTSFLAKSPSEKLALFSDIMKLDLWLLKSDEASQLTRELDGEINTLQTQLTRHEGQIMSLKDGLSSLELAEQNFKDEKSKKISIIKSEILKLIAIVDESWMSTGDRKTLKFLEEKRDTTLREIQRYNKEKSEYKGSLQIISTQISDCLKLGADCPTCLNEIDKPLIFNHIAKLKYEEKTFKNDITWCESDIQKAMGDLIRLNGQIDAEISKINIAEEKSKEVFVAKNTIKHLEAEISKIKAEPNTFSTMLIDKKKEIVQLEQASTKKKELKQALEVDHASISFWIKGFKRVRLFIIEQAFRTLELEINNSLAQLGMPDWQITFDIERENKSGGITKGFVTFVKSPANTEPVRWENWSGGETQRLQLAGDLGLANLICQQHGLTNKLEIYDEPSTHLSPEGMMDLADLLHDRAVTEGKRIWIADHTSMTNFGEFTGIITVRKNSDGSSITTQSS